MVLLAKMQAMRRQFRKAEFRHTISRAVSRQIYAVTFIVTVAE
jgi:hypothetical protein